ncbi:MAG TPA: hypothetical protein VFE86_11185 [Ilumatobacteraceae bacterium]|nr:hypothetical protein [Ilumatobacteraceae bacterium]
MTMILVDPLELNVISQTLRNCAAESADIGTQLWACAQCAMPADLDAAINALVSAADRVLDDAAANLDARATDLANRAAIAANDPVAATNVATGVNTSAVPGVTGGMNIVGGSGSFLASSTTVGGPDPFGGMSIVGGSGSFLASSTTVGGPDPFGGMSIVGGSGSFLPQPSTQSILGGAATVGGTEPLGGSGIGWTPIGAGIPGSSPLSSGLFNSRLFGNSTTPFLGSSGDSGRLPSFTEWSNDPRIDTDHDGLPNRFDNEFRNRDRP